MFRYGLEKKTTSFQLTSDNRNQISEKLRNNSYFRLLQIEPGSGREIEGLMKVVLSPSVRVEKDKRWFVLRKEKQSIIDASYEVRVRSRWHVADELSRRRLVAMKRGPYI